MLRVMTNSINATLVSLLDNHVARTTAALEGIPDEVFSADPGGGCNSIKGICQHLAKLIGFDLAILESPRAGDAPAADAIVDATTAIETLTAGLGVVRAAIEEHDVEDWNVVPDPPRDGNWGDEATLARLARPFNDYVNHLGGIRVIRRVAGAPAERTF
jgi:hypothetical protein